MTPCCLGCIIQSIPNRDDRFEQLLGGALALLLSLPAKFLGFVGWAGRCVGKESFFGRIAWESRWIDKV